MNISDFSKSLNRPHNKEKRHANRLKYLVFFFDKNMMKARRMPATIQYAFKRIIPSHENLAGINAHRKGIKAGKLPLPRILSVPGYLFRENVIAMKSNTGNIFLMTCWGDFSKLKFSGTLSELSAKTDNKPPSNERPLSTTEILIFCDAVRMTQDEKTIGFLNQALGSRASTKKFFSKARLPEFYSSE